MVELDVPVTSEDMIQFAVDTAENWVDSNSAPPMINCGGDELHECTISSDGMTISYSKDLDSENVKYAVNVVGRFVKPAGDWLNEPYEYTCGDPVPTDPPSTDGPTDGPTQGTPAPTAPPVEPGDCSVPELPPCPNRYTVHIVSF